jgi:hypothetical protein
MVVHNFHVIGIRLLPAETEAELWRVNPKARDCGPSFWNRGLSDARIAPGGDLMRLEG